MNCYELLENTVEAGEWLGGVGSVRDFTYLSEGGIRGRRRGAQVPAMGFRRRSRRSPKRPRSGRAGRREDRTAVQGAVSQGEGGRQSDFLRAERRRLRRPSCTFSLIDSRQCHGCPVFGGDCPGTLWRRHCRKSPGSTRDQGTEGANAEGLTHLSRICICGDGRQFARACTGTPLDNDRLPCVKCDDGPRRRGPRARRVPVCEKDWPHARVFGAGSSLRSACLWRQGRPRRRWTLVHVPRAR